MTLGCKTSSSDHDDCIGCRIYDLYRLARGSARNWLTLCFACQVSLYLAIMKPCERHFPSVV